MADLIAIVTVVIGFGLVAVGGAWLGVGAQPLFLGLFSQQGRPDWPHGVQEQDAPHFAVEHIDALRSVPLVGAETPRGAGIVTVDDATDDGPEVIELYTRRLAPRR